jgi:transposase
MVDLELVSIDLAKNVFQLHGCSSTGAVIFRKQLKRDKLPSFISELPTCTIAMEACSGSPYWGRAFEALGHSVRLIAPRLWTH